MIVKIREFVMGHLPLIGVWAAVIIALIMVFIAEGHKAPENKNSAVTAARETQKPKSTEAPVVSTSPTASPEGSPAASPSGTAAADPAQSATPAVNPAQNAAPAVTQKSASQSAPQAVQPTEVPYAQNRITGEESTVNDEAAKEYSEEHGMELDPKTGTDKYKTEPVPEGRPVPEEPQDVQKGDTMYTCTLSVSCATILSDITRLDKEKHELVPSDGWIFPPTKVSFAEGESVFDLLERTMRANGIHMEFVNTPMYNSAYIEGINNLYEFDCGGSSGWMYKVNGWFPNYGCSRYALHDGDVVEWLYTCDGGQDIK